MVMPGVSVADSSDKFSVLRAENGQSLNDGNMFATYRDIVKTCVDNMKAIPQPDGRMASHLQKVSSLAGIPVSCSPCSSLNQSHYVVHSRDLLRFSKETVMEEMAEQQVVRVERLKIKGGWCHVTHSTSDHHI